MKTTINRFRIYNRLYPFGGSYSQFVIDFINKLDDLLAGRHYKRNPIQKDEFTDYISQIDTLLDVCNSSKGNDIELLEYAKSILEEWRKEVVARNKVIQFHKGSNIDKLPIRELIKMLSEFYGDDYTKGTKEYKLKLISNYRKVETETNQQIEQMGGLENWYFSGVGRLMEL